MLPPQQTTGDMGTASLLDQKEATKLSDVELQLFLR